MVILEMKLPHLHHDPREKHNIEKVQHCFHMYLLKQVQKIISYDAITGKQNGCCRSEFSLKQNPIAPQFEERG